MRLVQSCMNYAAEKTCVDARKNGGLGEGGEYKGWHRFCNIFIAIAPRSLMLVGGNNKEILKENTHHILNI